MRGRSGKRRATTIFAGWRCDVASTSDRCAVVGSTPGFGSSAATSFMPEPGDQISESLVLDERPATPFSGAACRLPARDRRGPALGERLVARLVVRGVRGIELGQRRRQRSGDARDVARIGLDVRIARRDARRPRRDRGASALSSIGTNAAASK